jgi:hypothetical protein
MSDSYYELLGIDPDASNEEIETAYREKVKQVHPDKSDRSDAREQFMRVRKAREVLLDPKARARYDRQTRNTAQQGYQYQQQQQQQQQQSTTNNSTDQGSHQSRTRTSRQNQTETRDREQRWKSNTNPEDQFANIWVWILSLFENIQRTAGQFLNVVRNPSVSTDRSLLRSIVKSPTSIRLSATVMIVIVGTIVAQSLGYTPHESSSIGFSIVLLGLVGSYAGYEILSPLPFEESWMQNRSRYDPKGRQRIWPIAVTNALGVGLAFSAFINGAPHAGIAFTGALLLPFAIPLLVYSGTRPTRPGANRAFRIIKATFEDAYRFTSLVVTLVIALVLFTNLFTVLIDTPELLIELIGAKSSSSPWLEPVVVASVRVGLVLNFLIGMVMYICILWSMYAMWRYLNAAPWTDRYDHGYRVRPGLWNLLITGPFVVYGWMVLTGIGTIDVSLGISTIILTQDILLKGLFVLPLAVTGLYILRRQLEPTIRQEVYHQS